VVAATNQNALYKKHMFCMKNVNKIKKFLEGDDRAIFRVDVFRRMAFHCKILNALIC
jgi:hypothetical protein